MENVTYSVVIPVYKNQESIPRLLQALSDLSDELNKKMEAVFVVDGSPDHSFQLLHEQLDQQPYPAQLIAHSRNFGSFAAIRTGLTAAKGQFFAVMAADLQEPPELIVTFFQSLESDQCDVAIGTRTSRNDPLTTRIPSSIFWWFYRRFIVREMPSGGVDIFGCNQVFCQQLLKLEESRSSLIALIFWLGFRRQLFHYERLERQEGKSSWTFKKKFDYMLDSIFAFTDYPVRLLIRLGFIGCAVAILLGSTVLIGHFLGGVTVPGYATTMIVVLFFSAFNLLGLGLVGMYAWRGYENTKRRPLAIISRQFDNRTSK